MGKTGKGDKADHIHWLVSRGETCREGKGGDLKMSAGIVFRDMGTRKDGSLTRNLGICFYYE